MKDAILEGIKRDIDCQPFARMLQLRVTHLRAGHAVVEMDCPQDLVNAFGTVHRGAVFSLIDQAFGAAANTENPASVALNVDVSYLMPAHPGDTLRAEAVVVDRSKKTSTYAIEVRNQKDDLVATSHGLAYHKGGSLPDHRDGPPRP